MTPSSTSCAIPPPELMRIASTSDVIATMLIVATTFTGSFPERHLTYLMPFTDRRHVSRMHWHSVRCEASLIFVSQRRRTCKLHLSTEHRVDCAKLRPGAVHGGTSLRVLAPFVCAHARLGFPNVCFLCVGKHREFIEKMSVIRIRIKFATTLVSS